MATNMEQVYLLDVCDVYQPQTIATKQFIETGKYIVYGANGAIGKYDKYNHENSEVLMACRGATCGAINVSKPFSWVNGNAMVIHPNGKRQINTQYLRYCLEYSNKSKIITGTAQPQITRNNLRDFTIPLCSIAEQECIVAKIEELFSQSDKAIQTLQTVKQQLSIYRQSVLKSAFEQISNYVLMKKIADSRLGKMLDKEKNTGTYRKYLRNINVRWFTFDLSDLLEMKIQDDEEEKYSLTQDDLVICEGGEPGRCAVWSSQTKIYYQKALHRVRFKDGSNPKFYMYYIWFAAQTGKLTPYFTGTGIKHLTGQSLDRINVPTADRVIQDKIVSEIESRLSVCDSIEKTVDDALLQAEALRQSILKQAFTPVILRREQSTHSLSS